MNRENAREVANMAFPVFHETAARPVTNGDGLDHAVAEFSCGVQLMAEESQGKDTGIPELVTALTMQLQKHVRTKPHPTVLALLLTNVVAIIGLVFWCGREAERIDQLENRVRVSGIEAVATQVNDLKAEQMATRTDVQNLRDRIDRLLERRGEK